jgi:hypothetical protein
MLHWFRKHSPCLSRATAAGFVGLWLALVAAPCALAATPPCHQPSPPCATEHTPDAACPQASVNCELPSANAPPLSTFEFIFPVAVIAILPVPTPVPLTQAAFRAHDTRPPPATPPYLTHLALLL